MRFVLIVGAVAAAMLVATASGEAGGGAYDALGSFFWPARPEGPWCAKQNLGAEWVHNDCGYATLEACTQAVIAGNRGTCYPNPNWAGAAPSRRHLRKHKARHG